MAHSFFCWTARDWRILLAAGRRTIVSYDSTFVNSKNAQKLRRLHPEICA